MAALHNTHTHTHTHTGARTNANTHKHAPAFSRNDVPAMQVHTKRLWPTVYTVAKREGGCGHMGAAHTPRLHAYTHIVARTPVPHAMADARA